MKVQVELLGPLRLPWPERARDLELEPGLEVGALLGSLGYSPEEARHLSCNINGAPARLRTVLADGDRLTVMLLLGGG